MSEITTKIKTEKKIDPEHKAGLPPGTGVFQTWQVLKKLRADPLQFLSNLHKEHGDISRLRIGPYRIFLLNHPDYIKQVLQSNHQNYTKSSSYRFLKTGAGKWIADGGRRVLEKATTSDATGVSTQANRRIYGTIRR